jgi:translation initiation factor 2 subunit 1
MRIKKVNKLMRIGKEEIMQVIRVDRDKQYIDLSKKRVSASDASETNKYFKKAKIVNNILKQMAVNMDCSLISLYEDFGWDMYDHFEHAYNAFRQSLNNPDAVFSKLNISPEQKEELMRCINKKMHAQPVKIRADFEITCFTFEGVDALKEALIAAKK